MSSQTVSPARLVMIDLSGPRLTGDERAFLAERRPGGVCLFGRNIVDTIQVGELVAELRALAGPDLIVAVDQEGGGVVRLEQIAYPPSAMALGAADDHRLTAAVAAATGRGLRMLGINVDFAPVADVNSNPRNPVIADRSFGADPQHVARHVAAFIQGLQGAGVAATAKHFPGHGDVAVDSHLSLPVLERSPETLERLELPPFQAALSVDVAAVMTAHIVVPQLSGDLPATLSPAVVDGLLRGRLGFEGVVFSDALDMKAIAGQWSAPQAAVMAVAAGVDMPAHIAPVSEHEEVITELEQAVATGRLDSERVAASGRRLERLSAKFPGRPTPVASAAPQDDELLAAAARRGVVALGRLPVVAGGAEVVVLAAEAARQSAATQATVRPAAGLARALSQRGVKVTMIEYAPEQPLAVRDQALRMAASRLTIFASTARTEMTPDEAQLGREVAAAAREFAHVALWNPYQVAQLPGPALVTFGFRPRSTAAAAAVLMGAPAGGTAPVPLRTFDDIER